MFTAFWDAFLHTMVVKSDYLNYFKLLKPSGLSSLISLINKLFQSADPPYTECFWFFSSTLLYVKITGYQKFLKYSNRPFWYQQTMPWLMQLADWITAHTSRCTGGSNKVDGECILAFYLRLYHYKSGHKLLRSKRKDYCQV